jgi:hypothetical protein
MFVVTLKWAAKVLLTAANVNILGQRQYIEVLLTVLNVAFAQLIVTCSVKAAFK